MQRVLAFKYELMPTGEQQRQMRRFAGSRRFVFNQALALQKARYERAAYANFFAKRADYPRFKTKGQSDSFRFPVRGLRPRSARRCGGCDQLPGAGAPRSSLWRAGAVGPLDEAGTRRGDLKWPSSFQTR